MIISFFRTLTLRLLTIDLLRGSILKVYPYAISHEFSGLRQDAYLKLLSNFNIDAAAELKANLKRYGNDADGGYVLDSRITPETVCLSLGISNEVSFDLEISKLISRLEMYDFSISGLPLEVPKSTFHRLGISSVPREGFIPLEDAIERLESSASVILKMDIEGDEWDSLATCNRLVLERCTQIVVEFHNLQSLPLRPDFDSLMDQFSQQMANFAVVNVHGNNWDSFHIIHGVPVPNVIEVTYLRRDWLESLESSFNNRGRNLNLANNPTRPDLILESFKRIF